MMGSEDGVGRGTEQVTSITAKGKKFGIKEKLIFAQDSKSYVGMNIDCSSFSMFRNLEVKKKKKERGDRKLIQWHASVTPLKMNPQKNHCS